MGYNTGGSFGGSPGDGLPGDSYNASNDPSKNKDKDNSKSKQSWNPFDGWHDVPSNLTKPSLTGKGRMTTVQGWKDPEGTAREKAFYHLQRKQRQYNQNAAVTNGLVGQINNRVDNRQNWWTREPELEREQLRNGLAKKAYMGDVGSLRDVYGFNTAEMEDSFSPSGFAETVSSWFGEKPDKVDTFASGTQELLDKGLAEWKDNNLVLTTKGKWAGIGQIAAGPATMGLSNFAMSLGGPTAAGITNKLSELGFSRLTHDYPHKTGSRIGGAASGLAPYAASYSSDFASALASLSPLGNMYDTFAYGKQLDDLGIAPGGQSFFSRDPNTGAVSSINQGVVDDFFNTKERQATPNEFASDNRGQSFPSSEQMQAMLNPTQAAAQNSSLSMTYPEWWEQFHSKFYG